MARQSSRRKGEQRAEGHGKERIGSKCVAPLPQHSCSHPGRGDSAQALRILVLIRLCSTAREPLGKRRSNSTACMPDNALVAQLLADPEYRPLSTYKKQVRIMRMIDRVQRIFGKPFDLDDIEPLPDFKPLDDHQKFATVMEDRVRVLAALDRYERRAISKRKSAIRAFDSAWISRSREITDLA